MTRVDIIVLKRLGSRVAVTLVVVFGLLAIIESLNMYHYLYLAEVGGVPLALISLTAAAARWTLRTLTVTIIIGTIIGLLDLQARHELNVLKAAGNSIWRVLRAPLIAIVMFGLVVSLFLEGVVTQFDRNFNPTQTSDTGAITPDGAFWLRQTADGFDYIVRSGAVQANGTVLDDVTIFFSGEAAEYDRIIAPRISYADGAWVIPEGIGFKVGRPARRVAPYTIATASTAADLRVRLSSTQDLTFLELVAALSTRLTDPQLASAVATRLMRLITLPLLLAGSVLIGFAFTAGYRRANKYGAAVLYGIVLGFVVFFVTEMADRAGSVGALDPTFAAVAPAFVAVVVGLTVLLFREDGRA